MLRLYADVAPTAPDDLYVDFAMVSPPGGGDGVAMLSACYSGPAAGADKALAPLRKLAAPLDDGIKAVDYVDYQKSGVSRPGRCSPSPSQNRT